MSERIRGDFREMPGRLWSLDLSAHPLRMAKAGIEFIDIERPRRAAVEG